MIDTEYEKFRQVAINELPSSMWLQDSTTDVLYNKQLVCKIKDLYSSYLPYDEKYNIPNTKLIYFHTGLQLDIFVYKDVLKNNKRGLLLSFTANWVSQYKDLSNFHYSVIYPLREIEFEGIKVYVPNQLEKFCEVCYGNYPPSLPPIEKRYPHEGLIQPFEASPEIMEKYKELYSASQL
jgi:phosphorylcholine metabolism protein LicD